MENKKSGMSVWFSGFFGLGATVHLIRLLLRFPVTIGTWQVPMSVSVAIAVVFGALSLFLLKAGCCGRCAK